MLYVGWDWMGWIVIIGHRSSKSTFGANNKMLLYFLVRVIGSEWHLCRFIPGLNLCCIIF